MSDAHGRQLFIVRGLPGSGKTTAAAVIARGLAMGALLEPVLVAADDYFVDPDSGEYKFDITRIAEAHIWCQNRVRRGLQQGRHVVVHNTFTQPWELSPYLDIASEESADLTIISLFDGGLSDIELSERNKHGVPVEVIGAMRIRYEHDIRAAFILHRGTTPPPAR